MKAEAPYSFRRRAEQFFLQDCRQKQLPNSNELLLDSHWQILCTDTDDPLLKRAAFDLTRFLKRALGLSLSKAPQSKKIILQSSPKDKAPFASHFQITTDEITITGNSSRGTLFGIIYLEELMRLKGAPILPLGKNSYTPLTRMRSTHSGSALDHFPNSQLDAILHAGFTAIDLFVSGIDQTTQGKTDINDIIRRAASYGLDVVLYNYQTCYVHPEDKNADREFDRVFGSLFRAYPQAAALSLCGESLEFPSRDRTTVKKSVIENGADGLQDPRQPTGYYPNDDYPAYLQKLGKAVHKVAPKAEVIFSTYNWGWAPLKPRKKFLKALPKEINLQVTYDIFKSHYRQGLASPLMDYSIFAEEPGEYFETEVKAAHRCGLRNIRVTSNLAGTTWDFGCIPYAPVPFRWIKRMQILKKYLLKYDVNSFYDSHHFGWFPNICNDLAYFIFSQEEVFSPEAILLAVATRDYGKNIATDIVRVWKIWSDSMDHYVGSNEDQYGPWRVGPAYPFVFAPVITRTMDDKIVKFPFTSHSYRCACMVKPIYHPFENSAQSPGPLRYPIEIQELQLMLKQWEKGLSLLQKSLKSAHKKEETERLLALGTFIRNSIRTTIGIKKWFLANQRLQCASSKIQMRKELSLLKKLLLNERNNVLETIPCVQNDSRLGWEPRMDYVCDESHLRWKLHQLEITEAELKIYSSLLSLPSH